MIGPVPRDIGEIGVDAPAQIYAVGIVLRGRDHDFVRKEQAGVKVKAAPAVDGEFPLHALGEVLCFEESVRGRQRAEPIESTNEGRPHLFGVVIGRCKRLGSAGDFDRAEPGNQGPEGGRWVVLFDVNATDESLSGFRRLELAHSREVLGHLRDLQHGSPAKNLRITL